MKSAQRSPASIQTFFGIFHDFKQMAKIPRIKFSASDLCEIIKDEIRKNKSLILIVSGQYN